jgi:hypothetical protein
MIEIKIVRQIWISITAHHVKKIWNLLISMRQTVMYGGERKCGKKESGEKNRVKYRRYHGQEYTGHMSELKSEKSIKMFQHNCRYKCNNNFTKVSSDDFFFGYLELGFLRHSDLFLNKCFITNTCNRPAIQPSG